MAVIPWFEGIFESNGFAVSHLHIEGWGHLGLFGQVMAEARVVNLSVLETTIIGSGDCVGGLAGLDRGTLSGCCSTGVVVGHSGVGGLIGSNEWNGVANNCYATGDVAGGTLAGGLLGINWGKITACYSTGAVAGSPTIGGLVGQNQQEMARCFWDMVSSRQVRQTDGVGKATAEMQTASTFLDAGWDFVGETENGTEDIWWINEGKDYPRLWWEFDD